MKDLNTKTNELVVSKEEYQTSVSENKKSFQKNYRQGQNVVHL